MVNQIINEADVQTEKDRWAFDRAEELESKLGGAQSELTGFKYQKIGERIENTGKWLGLGGQAVAGLAFHPRAQAALKPIAPIAQILMGASTTLLGGIFKAAANKHKEAGTLSTIASAEKNLEALDRSVNGGPAGYNAGDPNPNGGMA